MLENEDLDRQEGNSHHPQLHDSRKLDLVDCDVVAP